MVHLAPFPVNIVDRFSWKDVKNLGQEILQTCEELGYGGRIRVGEQDRWVIRVFGFNEDPEHTNTTQTQRPNLPSTVRIVPEADDA